jgi:NitT/TauT family transport system ATP-binding protein
MRQRVALARALASTPDSTDSTDSTNSGGGAGKPSLLLMDEPFSALDAITRDVLQGELLRIWRATGTAILFVTHDVREAVRLGQRVVLLSSRPGRVVRQWDVDDAADRSAAVEEINAALRKVISSHAAA